jgi:aspartate racemase
MAGASTRLRTLGLIGGMSWESSAEYYRLINQGVRQRLGPLRSAPILMLSVDFGPIEAAQHAGRWDDAALILQDSARRLHAGGAEAIVLATNTMHKVADAIAGATPLPFIHIADPVGEAARSGGLQRLGLLGTAFTMEQDFIVRRLQERHGLEVIVPAAAERADVHRIIYEELCAGVVHEVSRRRYLEVIDALAAHGAQAVVLGCTEISLLVQQAHTTVPLLDSTALHAAAAVQFVLGPLQAPQRSGYWVSSEPRDIDFAAVHAYLSRSYWSPNIPRALVERAASWSIVFGLFHDTEQIGYARVISDRSTFAYLADVYVLEAHRGQGGARRLMEAVNRHPELQGLRRFMLVTRDAHGLYARHGFEPIRSPERFMQRLQADAFAQPAQPAPPAPPG